MKYLRHFAATALLATLVVTATAMGSSPQAHVDNALVANVDVTLQNKCTRDVSYTTMLNGATTKGTVNKGDKVRLSLSVGTKVCVDGEDFITVSATDAGQTFQVCR
jgi:hypothetical protein